MRGFWRQAYGTGARELGLIPPPSSGLKVEPPGQQCTDAEIKRQSVHNFANLTRPEASCKKSSPSFARSEIQTLLIVGGLASPGWGCAWNQTELVRATLLRKK